MSEHPHVICHMLVSVDGRIHPSRWTASPDGDRKGWSAIYERVHEELGGQAWMVGRATMAEMAKGQPHAPTGFGSVDRQAHFANCNADGYAVALDRSGKLHFDKPDVGGDHVVVLLGSDVADAHLAELLADGISYVVVEDESMAIGPMLEVLRRELGIDRLLLEGGGHINGSLLAAGLVDEASLLVAPAVDGGDGVTGVFDGADAGGRVRLSLKDTRSLEEGVVHLRYTAEA